MKSLISALLFSFAALALQGCSPQTTKPTLHDEASSKPAEYFTPEQLLQKANTATNKSTRNNLLIEAASKYYKNNLVTQSSAALREVDFEELTSDTQTQALLLNLKLGVIENIEWHLMTATNSYENSTLNKTNIEDLQTIIPLLAEAYEKQNQNILSAILLIDYSGIYDKTTFIDSIEKVWTLLRATSPVKIINFKYEGLNEEVKAWLELVSNIQQNQISLESQYDSFNQWKTKWPYHPAAISPPKELFLLSKLPETKPEKLIIALPFTGPVGNVGKAIRDGFIAAYIDHLKSSQTNTSSITFFDTHKYPLESLYENPPEKNSLIIGPLTKANVNKLKFQDLALSPTLALNYLDDDFQNPTFQENLYQFGLNPEAEINQLASLLGKNGLNKIAFIAHENELGFRIQKSLLLALQSHNSMLIESAYYQDQKSLSPAVASLLGTDLSLQRKNKLQRITNLSMEFEPRRRNDIDAVYMLAKPEIAKQLNPLFAYHYARDLPIYSSSQIHQVNTQQHDLDNIHFLEMPWMLSNSIKIKKEINDITPSSASEYSRFYALGADAFSLSTRLLLLKEVQSSQLQGQTGTLSIDSNGIVQRKLELAVFRKGKAIAIKE